MGFDLKKIFLCGFSIHMCVLQQWGSQATVQRQRQRQRKVSRKEKSVVHEAQL